MSDAELVEIYVQYPEKKYTEEELETIISKVQQAILNNHRDALQDKNYGIEYFRNSLK